MLIGVRRWVVMMVACVAVPALADTGGSTQAETQPAKSPAPHLELSPTSLDFGEVWEGEDVEGTYTVKNTGDAPLTVEVTSTCGCTVATQPKSPLAPGESDTFTIRYNTRYKGRAFKKVIVSTNDPDQANVAVQVSGLVKPLVDVEPTNRVLLEDLEKDTVRSTKLTYTNQFNKPIRMRLPPGVDYGPFDVQLKEIEEGQKYELTVTTKPPLREGRNSTRITLQTDMPDVATYTVHVHAKVPMRAELTPPTLYVTSNMVRPLRRSVKLQYRSEQPLKIVDVKATSDAVTWEVPAEPSKVSAKLSSYDIQFTLPAFKDMPDEGIAVTISTDDKREPYSEFKLRIAKRKGGTLRVEPVPSNGPDEMTDGGEE